MSLEDNVKRWALLGTGVLLFGIYLWRVEWSAVWAPDLRLGLGAGLAALVLNLGNGVLKLRRWQQLLASRRIEIARSAWTEYLAVNSGFFLGLVTPATAGELARAALSDVSESRSLAIIAFEKTTDLGVLLLLVLASFVVQFTAGLTSWILAATLLLMCGVVYAGYVRFDGIITAPAKWVLTRVVSKDRVITARRVYWEYYALVLDRKTLIRSSLFSLALWVLPVLQMFLLMRGLGTDVPLKTAALTFLLPYLVGLVSMIPSGIGSFDLAVDAVGGRALIFAGSGPVVASVAPLYFRLLVTVPLILLGLASHLVLNVGRRQT